MDRRTFLLRSASLLAGGICGLHSFTKAIASEGLERSSFLQPQIALIIDDIGYSLSRTRRFFKLGIPITFSILPRLIHSRDLACEIHDKGHEIMLHQPMEPYRSDLDPGPGALYVGYGADRIVRIMKENISAVPFAVGVNNHMGSRFSECGKEMRDALEVIGQRRLFFVDSLTSSHSMAYKTAKGLRMAAARRNIFLDNVTHESEILAQLHKLKVHAQKYGHAIGIGHPYPETAQAICQFSKDLGDSKVCLVHASRVVYGNNLVVCSR